MSDFVVHASLAWAKELPNGRRHVESHCRPPPRRRCLS